MKNNKSKKSRKNSTKTSLNILTILAVLLIILSSSGIDVRANNTDLKDPKLTYANNQLTINNNNIKISEQLWKKIQEQTNPGKDGTTTGWTYISSTNTLSKEGSPSIKIEPENSKAGHKGTVTFIQGTGDSQIFTQYADSTKGFLAEYSGTGDSAISDKITHAVFKKDQNTVDMNQYTYQLIRTVFDGTLNVNFNALDKMSKIEGVSSLTKEGNTYKTKDKVGREVVLSADGSTKTITSSTTISGTGNDAVKQNIVYESEGKVKEGSIEKGNKKFELKSSDEVTSWQNIMSSGKLGNLNLESGRSLFSITQKSIVLGSESGGLFGEDSTVSIVRSDTTGEKEVLKSLKSEALVLNYITAQQSPKKTVFYSEEYKQWLTMEFDQKNKENPKPTTIYDQNLRPVGIANAQGNDLEFKIKYDDKTGSPKIINGNTEYDLSKEEDLKNAIKNAPAAIEAIKISNMGPALEKAVSAAQGASALGNFLFKGNELIKAWKDTVDEIFKYLEPEQLVTGFFCSDYVRRNQDQGTALMFKGDQLNIVAHIEGSRSSAITYLDQSTNQYKTEYFYKITWNIKAPSDKDVNFNVRLQGQKEPRLFTGFTKIEKNQNNKVLGNTARIKYSPFFYDTVCIEFEGNVNWPNPLCNKITEYQGPTVEQAAQKQDSSTSASGSGASSVPNNDW